MLTVSANGRSHRLFFACPRVRTIARRQASSNMHANGGSRRSRVPRATSGVVIATSVRSPRRANFPQTGRC